MDVSSKAELGIRVFAKAPVPGEVKTRLTAAIGAGRAAALHARLARHTLETALAARIGSVVLCCAPDCSHAFFQNLADELGVNLEPQRGADLGERMYAAMESAMQTAQASLVIGTDCPFIDTGYLHAAGAVLGDGDVPVVIGPANDGGYVLIGASKVCRRLFENIPWGTDRVLPLTRQRLRALGWGWRELPPLTDIDRPQDLALLPAELLD
jgi:hypothetical protein